MKNKIIFILTLLFFVFCFLVFFKGLKNPNVYIPDEIINKSIIKFEAKDLFTNKKVNSDQVFTNSKFYVLNIWASWCAPCRREHSLLMEISKNKSIKLIGLNYKDSDIKAKKFIDELGNPYSVIITDIKGTISIELGAYGVPETFIIDKDKKIIKKIIGPLTSKIINEINLILK
tara:strand:- start:98 stop:619 length:522 start_codon:yes stop_codon:yes gene_type:complete